MTEHDDRQLASLAEEAFAPPDDRRAAAVRASLLAEAATTPQRTRRRLDVGTFAAAAIVLATCGVTLWWAMEGRPTDDLARSTSSRQASVTASGAATFEHRQSEDAEIVILRDGAIHLDVATLGPTSSFAVVTPDARIVVRGTAFSVVVEDEALRRVEVFAGRVEIEREDAPTVVLGAGETWTKRSELAAHEIGRDSPVAKPAPLGARAVEDAKVPRADGANDRPGRGDGASDRRDRGDGPNDSRGRSDDASGPRGRDVDGPRGRAEGANDSRAGSEGAPRAAERAPSFDTRSAAAPASDSTDAVPRVAPPAPDSVPDGAPSARTEPTPEDARFEVAFRRGWAALRAKDSASAARAFEEASAPGSPVAEEARYWHAIALLRDGRAAAAEEALRGLVERHPSSTRADEAALLIGRLRLDADDDEGARPWLQRAARSGRPAVRERANALLE